MALQKEHSEQQQAPRSSRFARERQDLSASVEVALHAEQEHPWHLEEDEASEYAAKKGTSLVPPRLSLQSRPMSVIRLDGPRDRSTRKLIVSATAELPAVSTSSTGGFLTRFARRLTSSLAIFGQNVQPEAFPVLPPPSSDEGQRLSRQHEDVSLLPFATPEEMAGKTVVSPHVATTPVLAQDQSAPPEPLPPISGAMPPSMITSPPIGPTRLGRHRQRLAGRTTKVRLQTAPVPAVPRPVTPRVSALEIAAAREKEAEGRTTLSNIPTVMMPREDLATVDETVAEAASITPIITPLELPTPTTAPSLSGSGVFEVGQSDVTIASNYVTDSSVVMVMLTSNPGPVVVQYISLLPRLSFTLHLTAPVETRTTFNYTILTGEPA